MNLLSFGILFLTLSSVYSLESFGQKQFFRPIASPASSSSGSGRISSGGSPSTSGSSGISGGGPSGGSGPSGGGGNCNSPPSNIEQHRAASLTAHNNYRALHGSPPLATDASLNESAQKYAQYLACNNKFEHSEEAKSGKYGENLAKISGNPAGNVAVDLWYDEINLYDFDAPGFSLATGHFTAVVWKASVKIGTGVASNGRESYIVSHYSPGGNVEGGYVANVLPK